MDPQEVNKLFVGSTRLGSDAIVLFVRALCSISADELRDTAAPRVYSLAKIVECAHFNMGRIRLVWSRIWAVLSEYFIKARDIDIDILISIYLLSYLSIYSIYR